MAGAAACRCRSRGTRRAQSRAETRAGLRRSRYRCGRGTPSLGTTAQNRPRSSRTPSSSRRWSRRWHPAAGSPPDPDSTLDRSWRTGRGHLRRAASNTGRSVGGPGPIVAGGQVLGQVNGSIVSAGVEPGTIHPPHRQIPGLWPPVHQGSAFERRPATTRPSEKEHRADKGREPPRTRTRHDAEHLNPSLGDGLRRLKDRPLLGCETRDVQRIDSVAWVTRRPAGPEPTAQNDTTGIRVGSIVRSVVLE
jgi:hypothetical protein